LVSNCAEAAGHVDGVRSEHLVQFEAALFLLEAQRPAARAGVAIEFRGPLAAGREQVWKTVAVAVERGDTAAHHVHCH
jgi:hypothetical protein